MKEITGIMVVGHGSRRPEANEDVRAAAQLIGERGGFALVAAAFLEIQQPDIAAAYAQLVRSGARQIIVHPYFLSPGRHTRGDLPREVRAAASQHPGVSYRITEPLSAHPAVIEAAVSRIRETLSQHKSTSPEQYRAKPGVVYLVGAGPGDPGLLTVRARDLLTSCEIVIYDNLVNPDMLSHASPRAELIYAGKVGHGHHTPQSEINKLLVDYARQGKRVVRLKGGDPLLFARGGEEAEALHAAGIQFEIVPGVSSALAVPAYAGIPLTHRGLAASVALITGTRSAGASSTPALAAIAHTDTIVVLMGIAQIRDISRDLIAARRSPDTPAAVICQGTYEQQQTVTGTLRSIADDVERAKISSPAIIVIGEVVRLRHRLKWFESMVSANKERALAIA